MILFNKAILLPLVLILDSSIYQVYFIGPLLLKGMSLNCKYGIQLDKKGLEQ